MRLQLKSFASLTSLILIFAGCATTPSATKLSNLRMDKSTYAMVWSKIPEANRAVLIPPQNIDPSKLPRVSETIALLDMAYPEADDLPRKIAIALHFVSKSDRLCYEYMTSVNTLDRGISAGLRTSALLFTALTGLATPINTKNALAAGTSLVLGTEETLRGAILNDQTSDALIGAVEAKRYEEKLKFFEHFHPDNRTELNYLYVMNSIEQYHDTCGISAGSRALVDAVKTYRNESQKLAEEASEPISEALANSEPS